MCPWQLSDASGSFRIPDQQYGGDRYCCQKRRDCDYASDRSEEFLYQGTVPDEGVIIGLVGAALPLAVLYYLYHKIVLYVAAEFNMLTSVMKFLPVNELFSTLLPCRYASWCGYWFLWQCIHQSAAPESIKETTA